MIGQLFFVCLKHFDYLESVLKMLVFHDAVNLWIECSYENEDGDTWHI